MKKFNLIQSLAFVASSVATLLVAEEPKGWQTTATVNAAVAKGNSDTLLMGAALKTLRKWDKNEVNLGADATYGNNRPNGTGNQITTAQNFGALAQYNRLLTDRWFLSALVDGRTDRIAGIKHRVTLAPSAGYYVVKKEKISLSFEAGPALIFENLAGTGSTTYLSLRFAENFRWTINEQATLQQKLEYLPRVSSFEDYVANFDLTLSTKINEKLSATITFQDFYRSVPAIGRKENDLRLLAGLGYTF